MTRHSTHSTRILKGLTHMNHWLITLPIQPVFLQGYTQNLRRILKGLTHLKHWLITLPIQGCTHLYFFFAFWLYWSYLPNLPVFFLNIYPIFVWKTYTFLPSDWVGQYLSNLPNLPVFFFNIYPIFFGKTYTFLLSDWILV